MAAAAGSANNKMRPDEYQVFYSGELRKQYRANPDEEPGYNYIMEEEHISNVKYQQPSQWGKSMYDSDVLYIYPRRFFDFPNNKENSMFIRMLQNKIEEYNKGKNGESKLVYNGVEYVLEEDEQNTHILYIYLNNTEMNKNNAPYLQIMWTEGDKGVMIRPFNFEEDVEDIYELIKSAADYTSRDLFLPRLLKSKKFEKLPENVLGQVSEYLSVTNYNNKNQEGGRRKKKHTRKLKRKAIRKSKASRKSKVASKRKMTRKHRTTSK